MIDICLPNVRTNSRRIKTDLLISRARLSVDAAIVIA